MMPDILEEARDAPRKLAAHRLAMLSLYSDGAFICMEPPIREAINLALEALSSPKAVPVEELRQWASEQASRHHQLAHENKDLRVEHIASSSAYRELANRLETMTVDRGG